MKFKKISRHDLIYKATKIINKVSTPVEISFYESPEWRKAQEEYLKTNPLCELCLNDGIKNKSDDVHHIIPLTQGGEPFSEDNLIALCDSCHSSIHSSGGIALDININIFGPDPLNNFTTQLKNINEDILSKCKEDEDVNLIRERKPDDSSYVGVANILGEHIGDINPHEISHYYLAFDIDHGAETSAKIKKIFIDKKRLQCIIEISKGDIDFEEYDKFLLKEKEASQFINQARIQEKTDCEEAIRLYRKANEMLLEIDRKYDKYPAPWRYVKFPINRISLVLERQKKYKECLKEIEKYQKYDDKVGLYRGEKEIIEKRKAKILSLMRVEKS